MFVTNYLQKMITLGFLFIVIVIIPENLIADDMVGATVLKVTGAGVIKRNVAYARELAITDSLSTAVGLTAIDLLSDGSLVDNFPTLNRIINKHTGKFIQGYKVLAETRLKKSYHVLVQVKVLNNNIRKFLAQAGFKLDKKALPRILFVMTEHDFRRASVESWWDEPIESQPEPERTAEEIITEIMQAKGFVVLKDEAGRGIPITETSILESDNRTETSKAVDLGTRMLADIVIIGDAFANQLPNSMGSDIHSYKGTIKARVIRIDTGEEIASVIQTYVTVNTDRNLGCAESIAGAASLAGEKLVPRIISAWQEKKKPSEIVEIIVAKIENLSDFIKFRKIMSDMQRVKDIQTREMKSDRAILAVDFQGNTKELADSLLLRTFDSFGINISEVTSDHLVIHLVSINNQDSFKYNP